eukprot:5551836-Ditylum_brightwellii.AAC.1
MEADIDELILRINALECGVSDKTKVKKDTDSSLSEKLRILEEELDLEQKDKSLPARISGLEENIVMRIAKLEGRALEQTDVDASTKSLADRLSGLEKALDMKPPSSVLFQRIKSL